MLTISVAYEDYQIGQGGEGPFLDLLLCLAVFGVF